MRVLPSLIIRYRIVAFVSGFVLMAYELAGARILSPVVGSSTYVWTSIIGVIIAALSVGYFLGGWLADKRTSQADIVIILVSSAVGVLLTLILGDVVLQTVGETKFDIRLQALLASLLLFAPTSILLGAISPYLVRMHTSSLGEAGRSVALLSALNSLGGIVGTFTVGFIFFGFIGSEETLLLLTALLLLSSLLLITRDMLKSWLIMSSIMILVSLTFLLSSTSHQGVVASIETPSSSYLVSDIFYRGEAVRVLTMGPGGFQSGIYLDGRKDLVFDYAKTITRSLSLHSDPSNILVLGGGSFTIPEYLASNYPDSHIDVVEIDPELEEISKQYFSYSSPENVTIFSEDARTFVNRTSHRYDVIITDAYSDTGIPFAVTTAEFATKITGLLKHDGVVLMNVISGDNPKCRPLLRGMFKTFSKKMTGTALPVNHATLRERQNIIFAFSKTNTNWLQAVKGSPVQTNSAEIFTDNYAPVERFHQNCLNS